MNDSYAECLVRRKKRNGLMVLILAAGAGALLAGGSIPFIGLWGFVIFVLLSFLITFLNGFRNVEYEYLLADKEFSVDVIYNKMRRKKMGVYRLEEVLAVAPAGSAAIKEYDRQVKKVTDLSSGFGETKCYAFVCKKSGVFEKVMIEPDERMIKCFRMMAPGKFSEY